MMRRLSHRRRPPLPPDASPIARLRYEHGGLSQVAFAASLQVRVATIRALESGLLTELPPALRQALRDHGMPDAEVHSLGLAYRRWKAGRGTVIDFGS